MASEVSYKFHDIHYTVFYESAYLRFMLLFILLTIISIQQGKHHETDCTLQNRFKRVTSPPSCHQTCDKR